MPGKVVTWWLVSVICDSHPSASDLINYIGAENIVKYVEAPIY
jgi:hypothetical protein